jgi:hypothetical protein
LILWQTGNAANVDMRFRQTDRLKFALHAKKSVNSWMFPVISLIAARQDLTNDYNVLRVYVFLERPQKPCNLQVRGMGENAKAKEEAENVKEEI